MEFFFQLKDLFFKKLLLLQQWRLDLIFALSHVSNSFHLRSIEIPKPPPLRPYGHETLVSLQNTRPPPSRPYGHETLFAEISTSKTL
ncbi:hypothetical protein AT1G62895 [Arabidopsis thaliana]|uniref:Uncharacterized protein n=1 Tax=Arabidopsis thaliana TaxID=3702 RepID=A0A1P8ARQ4_ARATH|nr:uncharacterized protein AT1G62895 [Arabidopsis thaliana]ANM59338.1 hypothetical protein AT1G62895 [Arabidopsis thaliana]|eukprot:NP_001321703.1 hypothetical protein AT1G62895 [Arabidopsis thaliana]